MEPHLLDVPVTHPVKAPEAFDHETVVTAQSLLDDDFRPARQEGYISSADVTRQVEPDVWEAMRAIREA